MALRILDRDTIFKAMSERLIKLTDITNFNPGGVARTLLETVAECVAELYAFGGDCYKQGFVETATGTWLTRHARAIGLFRKSAATAVVRVKVTTYGDFSNAISLPAGTLLSTARDADGTVCRVTLDDDINIPAASEAQKATRTARTALGLATATAPGARYNLDKNTALALSTYKAGVDSVVVANTGEKEADNREKENWLKVVGADEENDASLRRRCVLRWSELSTGSTPQAYVAWAMGVKGVSSAWVDDRSPRGEGTVDVYVTCATAASGFAPATAETLLAVQKELDSRRPCCVDVLAKAPAARHFSFSLQITPRALASSAEIDTAVRSRLRAWFGNGTAAHYGVPELVLGSDIVLSRLLAIVVDTPGVYSAALRSVSSGGLLVSTRDDISIDASEIALLDADDPAQGKGLQITFSEASREP